MTFSDRRHVGLSLVPCGTKFDDNEERWRRWIGPELSKPGRKLGVAGARGQAYRPHVAKAFFSGFRPHARDRAKGTLPELQRFARIRARACPGLLHAHGAC